MDRRAQRRLLDRGVPPRRIFVAGLGEHRPPGAVPPELLPARRAPGGRGSPLRQEHAELGPVPAGLGSPVYANSHRRAPQTARRDPPRRDPLDEGHATVEELAEIDRRIAQLEQLDKQVAAHTQAVLQLDREAPSPSAEENIFQAALGARPPALDAGVADGPELARTHPRSPATLIGGLDHFEPDAIVPQTPPKSPARAPAPVSPVLHPRPTSEWREPARTAAPADAAGGPLSPQQYAKELQRQVQEREERKSEERRKLQELPPGTLRQHDEASRQREFRQRQADALKEQVEENRRRRARDAQERRLQEERDEARIRREQQEMRSAFLREKGYATGAAPTPPVQTSPIGGQPGSDSSSPTPQPGPTARRRRDRSPSMTDGTASPHHSARHRRDRRDEHGSSRALHRQDPAHDVLQHLVTKVENLLAVSKSLHGQVMEVVRQQGLDPRSSRPHPWVDDPRSSSRVDRERRREAERRRAPGIPRPGHPSAMVAELHRHAPYDL